MEKIETGGPAFPIRERAEHLDGAIVCNEWPGISKREYFAAAALTGLIVADELATGNIIRANCTPHPATAQEIAKSACEAADAMLFMLKQSAQTEKGES